MSTHHDPAVDRTHAGPAPALRAAGPGAWSSESAARPAAGEPGRRPAPGRLTRRCRSMVLGILRGMPEGHLRMVLPGGETLRFGRDESVPPLTVTVRSDDFFRKCVLAGDIGLGESYVDGDWDADDLAGVISWFLLNINHAPGVSGGGRSAGGVNILKWVNRIGHLVRDNSPGGSRKNISDHYDLSNEFFSTFLDPSMTYSSALFARGDESLEEAQTAKYDRLCRELKLSPGHHVLEIGSGWGGFAIHAASSYGCRVTTITVSRRQLDLARLKVAERGLSGLVEVLFCDYRAVEGLYDRVVSIEMIEAVGDRHMESFFGVCHRVLKPSGAMGLQVIVSPDSRYESIRKGVDWIQKHVFPGSLLPSIARINGAVNRTGEMSLRDLKDFGPDYARTLATWKRTFESRVGDVRGLGFDERFTRKWNYYLNYCEAAFRMRNISVVQMVYTRPNNYSF
jgi:cyclopropane-fatty-acyl-phospholipid synthase